VANRLGAIYDPGTLSYSLPPQVVQRLISEVKAIREKQQGKKAQDVPRRAPHTCGNPALRVSPAIRQRATRETQTGSHLLREEGRIEEVLSPNPPFQDSKAQKDKDSPDEDEPDELLKCARRAFIGVMDDMRAHLLDTSRPPNPRFANGFAEWERFGFGSLAVERTARRGTVLELMLSAREPAAAHEGLKKYRRTWEPSLRTWYGCTVEWEIQETKQT
jgi:hypothetical protein